MYRYIVSVWLRVSVWCGCGCACMELCVYMYVVAGGCILCGCVCTSVYAHVEARSQHWGHSLGAIPLALWESPWPGVYRAGVGQVGWPMRSRNPLVSVSPSTGITSIYPHAQLFTWVLGTECKSSYLKGKHYQLNYLPVQRLLWQFWNSLSNLMCDISPWFIYGNY